MGFQSIFTLLILLPDLNHWSWPQKVSHGHRSLFIYYQDYTGSTVSTTRTKGTNHGMLGILDGFQSYWTVLNHIGLFWIILTVLHHLGLFTKMLDNIGSFWTIWYYFGKLRFFFCGGGFLEILNSFEQLNFFFNIFLLKTKKNCKKVWSHGAGKVSNGARKVSMVPGKCPMVPKKRPMVPGRCPTVPRRYPMVPGRCPMVSGSCLRCPKKVPHGARK